jgi:hypothetical protein
MKQNILSQCSKNRGGVKGKAKGEKGREEIGRSFPVGYLDRLKGSRKRKMICGAHNY